jgi:hypothetical protein
MDLDDIALALEVLGPPGPSAPPPDSTEQPSLIPYERQHRVPEALLPLEAATSQALGVPTGQLVILMGRADVLGPAAVFERRTEEGVEQVQDYVVAWALGWSPAGRLKLALMSDRAKAVERYRQACLEVL